MRVHVVSDCHTDYADNRNWLDELARGAGVVHRGDALVVAGDVSDDLPTLVATLERFKSVFGEVLFVPGNHVRSGEGGAVAIDAARAATRAACAPLLRPCRAWRPADACPPTFTPDQKDLWVRRQERDKYDSLQKLAVLKDACARLGVHTAPVRLAGVWLAPLLSWYHARCRW